MVAEEPHAGDHWLVVVEEAFVPTDSGGRAETRNFLLAAQSAGIRLHVVVPGIDDVTAHAHLLADATLRAIPRSAGWSAHLSLDPYVVVSRPLPAGLAEELATQHRVDPFDLIVAQTFRVAHLGIALAQRLKVPLVVRPHNVESAYFRHLARSSTMRRSLPYLAESLKLRRTERQVHRSTVVTAFADMSVQDADYRRSRTRTPVLHVPPVLPPDDRAGAGPGAGALESAVVLFIGSLDNANNRDAVRWLVEQVWPLVSARRPSSALHVVGRRASSSLRELVTGVGGRLTADAPSTAPHLAQAAMFVNPVQQGSGVNMKVVEAMLAGLPVLSTSSGSRGLDWQPGADLLVADTPADFAAGIVTLLEDPELRTRVGAAGQRFVRSRLDGARAIAQLQRLAGPVGVTRSHPGGGDMGLP